MNAVVDQLVPPNAVSFAKKFTFLSNNSSQEALLVIKTNLAEVYVFNEQVSKLMLFSKHTLAARVESIQVLSRPGLNDLVFLSFADCKICSLQYSHEIGDFVTKSLHFFENEELRNIGCVLGNETNLRPHLHLDPEGRMIAARIFASHLALIPLVKANGDEFDHGEEGRLDSLRSHVLNFSKQIDARLKNVRRLEFLPGFLNPTLAILYDRGSNCEQENIVARSAVNQSFASNPKETCALMIIAIEPVKLSSKLRSSSNFQFTVINNIENIPWDCFDMFPLPKPVGGLLMTSTNMLLWCDISSSAAPHCIPVNLFASLTYSGRMAINTFASINIPSLHDCKMLPIGVNADVLKLLLITALGEHYLLSITRSGRTLGFFNLEVLKDPIPPSPGPSSIALLNPQLLFLATESGSCRLLKISQNLSQASKNVKTSEKSSKEASNSSKSALVSKSEMDDIDAYLYGEEAPKAASKKQAKVNDDDYLASLENEEAQLTKNSSNLDRFSFSVIDELECLGPSIDIAVGCTDVGSLELVSVGGNCTAKDSKAVPGTINVITQGLPVQVAANFTLPDTKSIWSIKNEDGNTKFLVASTLGSTLVLAVSEAKIDEVEESAFYLEGPTLFCSEAHADDGTLFILQIDTAAIRILDFSGKRLLSQFDHTFSSIKNVSCYRGGVLVLLSDGFLCDFVFDAHGQVTERQTNLNGIATFTIYRQKLLFMVTEKGALGIFTVQDRLILFENSAFNRLPAALFNRLGGAVPVSELNQRIVALDVLDSVCNTAECFLIVHFETEGERSSRILANHTYRVNLTKFSLLRVSSKVIGKLPSGSQTITSVPLHNNELVILAPNASSSSKLNLIGINDRNYPRNHRLSIKDAVLSIASYNDNSLLILKNNGAVSIVDWQKQRTKVNLNWDSELVLQRLSLPHPDRVPTSICFHPPSKTYLVASAPLTSDFKLPADEYAPISDNQSYPTVDGTERLPKLFAAQSSALHLLNPIAWSFVDEAVELFLPYETVSCIKTLELATQQTTTGFHPFLTVGTAYQKSEDRPIRGRGIVFDVAEVIPEIDRPETNRKLRLKGITEFKGPVFAMTPLLDGNVAISLGQKVVIHTFEEDEKFAGVAFHDIDLTKSIAFLAFQAEPLARIHALGRDYGQNLQCSAVEFLVNSEGQAMIVAADNQGGLHFYSYAPANLTTNSGQRLLDKGSFFLHGSPVNKLVRLPVPGRPKDSVVLAAGQDGSIHLLSPLPVSSFRRLYVLEMRLASVVPDIGGLTTRVARQVPRRMTVAHALPVTGQMAVSLPTSVTSTTTSDSSSTQPATGSTIIMHHLPVSNSIVDGLALRRFFSDPLFDGLARQTLSNRFGLDYTVLMEELSSLFQLKYLF